MDIDENNLIKNSNRKQCNQNNEKISSIFPITTKNNPCIITLITGETITSNNPKIHKIINTQYKVK